MFSLQAHLGRHTWDLPLDKFETIAQLSFIAELSFLICQGCTKISVLLFYRRLVKDTYAKVWKFAVIGAIVFTALWTLAFLFLLIFNCSPTEAYWRSFKPTYTRPYNCVDTTIVNLLAGIFAIISDFYAVVLPCMMTRRFDLPRAQKLALNGLFSIGLVVVAAGAVRTYYLYRVGHTGDVSWNIFNATAWSQCELQLGVVCASLPTMRVLFRKYLNNTTSRAISNVRSLGSHNSQHSRMGSIRRVNGPDDRCEREEFSMKHMRTVSEMKELEGEPEHHSPSSTSPSTTQLFKGSGPEKYALQHVHEPRGYPAEWPLAPHPTQPRGSLYELG
ncbi:hypothetical protein LTR78_002862 [Recurvomyces mirabilis]|uniref:Rhodopsin domain-containing protein n=1 Tax=Recurvomyces mirabilis TaxID=574656 RepID=A0AAE0WTJ3_9PEZI|nr:hypothetical protein LTR78_002862 [Recurvomyces mirabilis]KAK5159405.1 hypothetical protein LTS14_002547 [Recurvomyces mirabilis]